MSTRAFPRVDWTEAGASVADLGTLLPIAAALVLVNGVDPVAAFGIAGALFLVAGLIYRVPVPVQPIKAAAAIAIATRAPAETIAAAGVVIGCVLLVLAVTRSARFLARVFPKPIIRGNQLGVGLLLLWTSITLVRNAEGSDPSALMVWTALVAAVALAGRLRAVVCLGLVAGGIAWSVATGVDVHLGLSFALPSLHPPSIGAMGTALGLLVIPQIPLTLGNAIVGVADLEREYYGARASRVTPTTLCASSGAANVLAGLVSGMPLCHGSSGATAYYRFGARTGGVNVVAGVTLLVAGLAFGRAALTLFAAIPPVVLGALLAYTGVRHALLVGDLRGWSLLVALVMGGVGGATRNLTYGMVAGFAVLVLVVPIRRAARELTRPPSARRPRIFPSSKRPRAL